MMPFLSMNIRIRLALTFTVVVTLILVVFSFMVYEYYAIFRQNNFFLRLKEKSLFTARALLDANDVDVRTMHSLGSYQLKPMYEQQLCIYDKKNTLIQCIDKEIGNNEVIINKTRRLHEWEMTSGDTQMVGIEVKHSKGDFIVISTAYDRTGYKKQNLLRNLIIAILLLSVAFAGYVGWWFSNEALKPMKQVMKEVDDITAKDIHKRVKVGGSKDEISQLATTFNNMLDRVEYSLTIEKTFLANASHEYRTPLTAMKGQIEVSLMQSRSIEEYVELLKSVQEEINRMIELQRSLGELMDTNNETRIRERFKAVPLLEIIADARSSIMQSKPHYFIQLNISEYPDEQLEASVIGEENLLKSAFINLMDNACKFSPSHKAEVNITFHHSEIHVTVVDKGIGIPQNELADIFQPFYRGRDIRNIQGHGLGLPLVKRIVELHNGTIGVVSKEREGTTFTVILPTMVVLELA